MLYRLLIGLLALSQLLSAQSNAQNKGNDTGGKRIDFVPSSFSNQFSLHIPPVLKIHSGDTVSTETLDASGVDKNAVKRQKGGNPLTGPFFIEDAKAGDVLAITLTKLSLNRSYAFTTEAFGGRSLPKELVKNFKKFAIVRWNLDTKTGFASPVNPYEHLAHYKVPLRPFIGCIGVAPSTKNDEILSFFSGDFGGNLDFSAVAQSATIYLPVLHDGAYLYFGDGHALQGDGELAGNALETSLDIEFTVRLINQSQRKIIAPRVEDATYLMAVGLDKTLDNALKLATAGLLEWLALDYHLSIKEATQVMSTSIEYSIAEIADPEVEVVAKIKKELLKGLQ